MLWIQLIWLISFDKFASQFSHSQKEKKKCQWTEWTVKPCKYSTISLFTIHAVFKWKTMHLKNKIMIKYDCAADESIDQYQMSKHYFFYKCIQLIILRWNLLKAEDFIFERSVYIYFIIICTNLIRITFSNTF